MKIPVIPRRTHISWHIASWCLGVVIAIALAAGLVVPGTSGPVWQIAGLVLTAFSCSRQRRSFLALSLLAGLALGLWRGSNVQQALHGYDKHIGQTVTIQGTVNEDVTHGDRGDTRMTIREIVLDGRPMTGKIWVSTTTKAQIKRSDRVLLQGKLKDGFGSIPASMTGASLRAQTTASRSDFALRFRDWFAAGIRRAVPEPQASLGSGFLTGQHSDLAGNLDDELRIVGLTHAVVASGSNLTILVAFTRRLLMRVSKYTVTMSGTLMAAGFTLVAGFSPSMTRASLVTGLSLAAWHYGRRVNPLVLLPLAAGVTSLYNPTYLWGDIGWYLSFGAFTGVLVIAPLVQHYFWGPDHSPNILTETFIGTIAAQLATMPVILFSFGTLSAYALLANMLVVPLIPAAMLLTFTAGIAGVALPGIATVIGWPAMVLMKYMTIVIHWTASLPGSQATMQFNAPALVATYAVLLGSLLYLQFRTNHDFGQDTNRLIGDRA